MKDITLRRPRNPYTQFVLAEVGSFRTKNKEAKIDLQEFNQTCAEKWKKMKEGDKKKYLKQYEEACELYFDAVNQFMLYLKDGKSEKIKGLLLPKIDAYMKRAKELRNKIKKDENDEDTDEKEEEMMESCPTVILNTEEQTWTKPLKPTIYIVVVIMIMEKIRHVVL